MAIDRQPNCPSKTELLQFSEGVTETERSSASESHLSACQSCDQFIQNEIASTENNIDTISKHEAQSLLVAELQTMNLHPADIDDSNQQIGNSVPEKLLEIARNQEPAPNRITFDAGQRLAKLLEKGPCQLGRFELQSILGVGSFGYVFKAKDPRLNRLVALKVQRAGTFATEEETLRFRQEAQSVASLSHQGIASVYDTIQSEEGTCYLVTQYIEGKTLESILKNKRPSFDEAAVLVSKIADALHYAHENGVVHRDVKPSNIMIDKQGNPFVMDFGLAKNGGDQNTGLTSDGRILGTPGYMSPEQASGDSQSVDARSDVYSLGVVLYELLGGRAPFLGNRQEILQQVLTTDPKPPRILNQSIPLDLDTICLKAISKSKNRRYQSANEFSQDLHNFLISQPILARPQSTAEKLWRWCGRYPIAASLLFLIPFITIGGFSYFSWLSTHIIQTTALESTRMKANMLEDINEFYSEEIVGHLDKDVTKITHKYTSTPNSVPLPFTFMIDAGEKISKGESGMKVKIYSDFPWRRSNDTMDEFEKRAIERLGLACRTEPDSESSRYAKTSSKDDIDGRSYFEFTEVDREPVLRYARAQIMKKSCINCHNHDITSPKRNWVEGEVAGVLSITRPLKRDIDLTRKGLQGTFHLIGAFSITLFVLAFGILWSTKKRPSKIGGVK